MRSHWKGTSGHSGDARGDRPLKKLKSFFGYPYYFSLTT